MSSAMSRLILAAGFALLLLGAVAWSYGQMTEARDAAAAASADLHRCRILAEQIRQLAASGTVAAGAELETSELVKSIEHAAAAAQLDPASLLRISPEPAARIADSSYKEKPTRIELRAVTLQQLTRFLCGLCGEGSGLTVKSLRIGAPRGEDASDRWDAECTLAYLIYEPPANKPTPQGARRP